MVVGICQLHIITFFDYRIIHGGVQYNLGGTRITSSTTTAGRDINGCNLGSAFVLERKANGTFIIADFGAHVKYSCRIDLVEFGRNGTVLYRVGTACIEGFVHLLFIDYDIHLALCVWGNGLPIYAYLLDFSTTVFLPTGNCQEVFY